MLPDLSSFQQFAVAATFDVSAFSLFKQQQEAIQKTNPQNLDTTAHANTDHADITGTHTNTQHSNTSHNNSSGHDHSGYNQSGHNQSGYSQYSQYSVSHYNVGPNVNTHVNWHGNASLHPGSHSNTPHSNTSHSNSSHSNSSGHNQAGYNQAGYNQTPYTNVPHSNVGFDHQNYIPFKPALYDIADGKVLRGTVTIGLYSYDGNRDGAGTQTEQSTNVKYDLYIKKAADPDADYKALATDMAVDAYDFDTALYPDGSYVLKAVAKNDAISRNSVTKTYVSDALLASVTIKQNTAPVISVENGNEFINFTFGKLGALTPAGIYKDYSQLLYSEVYASNWNKDDGLFIVVNMKDIDTWDYQKGIVKLKRPDNSIMAEADIFWTDNPAVEGSLIVNSANAFKTGYAYFDSSLFDNENNLDNCTVHIEVTDYSDAACTVPAGGFVVSEQVSAVDTTVLNFDIDTKSPGIPSIVTETGWVNRSNVEVSITSGDDNFSGVEKVQYQLSGATVLEWTDYTGSFSITNEGITTISARTVDKAGNKSNVISAVVKIDRTLPTAGAPNVTAESSSRIMVTPDALDEASGLDSNPYMYNIDGTDTGVWEAGTYADTGLQPNTQHTYRYKARDIAGNISEYSETVSRYTQALNAAGATITGRSASGVDISVTGDTGNKNAPEYLVEVRKASDGNTVSVSDWSTTTERSLYGLIPDEEYEIWVTTRNGDKLVNAPVKLLGSIYCNHTPSIELTDSNVNYVISEVAPHNTVTLSGKIFDPDGDNCSVTASVYGITKSVNVTSVPDSLPGSDNWSLQWDGSELPEGDYTYIVITVTDAKGTQSTVAYTGTITVDKEAPTITLNGLAEVDVKMDTSYTDEGATAVDNNGGDITSNIVVDNPVNIAVAGTYTVTYSVTDPVGNTGTATRTVRVRNYMQEILDGITAEKILETSRIDLSDLEENQQYNIKLTDLDTNTVLVDDITKTGGSIPVDLMEGHTYKLDMAVTDNGTVKATKSITFVKPDVTAPVITGAYILHGTLYILATDNYGLNAKPYAFVSVSGGNSTVLSEKVDGQFRTIVGVINQSSIESSSFDVPNYINVQVPTNITAYVKDKFDNITSANIDLTRYNQVLFGSIPQDIQNQIYNANHPKVDPIYAPPVTGVVTINDKTGIEVTGQLSDAINAGLSDSNLTFGEMPLSPIDGLADGNNPTGLTVSIGSGLIDIKNTLAQSNVDLTGVNFRLDVIEKSTRLLVYTKQNITDPQNVVIPNLQDATVYIIKVTLMVNDTVLAFKEVEQETADKTPPVIESVVMNNGTTGTELTVYATDNKGLDTQPYQYKISGNGVAWLNPFGSEPVASIDNSTFDWNMDAWTDKSRLKELDTGVKVTIKVRDKAQNYAVTTVEVGKANTVNAGINSNDPLQVEVGAGNISSEDIIRDALSKLLGGRLQDLMNIRAKFVSLVSEMQRLFALNSNEYKEFEGYLKRATSLLDQLIAGKDPSKAQTLYDQLIKLLEDMKEKFKDYRTVAEIIGDIVRSLETNSKMPLMLPESAFNTSYYNISVSDSSIGYIDSNGKLITLKEGILILDITNNKTGQIFKYVVKVGKVAFDRRIIVEVGSQTSLARVFNNPLLRELGTSDVQYKASNDYIAISKVGIITAQKPGLSIVTAESQGKAVNLYVIVMEQAYPMSDVKTLSADMLYLAKVGDVIDSKDMTLLYKFEGKLGESANTDYIIAEPETDNVEMIDNTMFRVKSKGVARVRIIDLVTKKAQEIDMMVEDFVPTEMTDIKGNKYESDIADLANKGLLKGTEYHPGDIASKEQFLIMLSRAMLYKGIYNGIPVARPEGDKGSLAMSPWGYYNIMEVLKNSTEHENAAIFGDDKNLKNKISTGDMELLLKQRGISVDVRGIIGEKDVVTRGEMAAVIEAVLQNLK